MLSADQEWENFLNTDTLQDSNEEKSSCISSFIPKVTEIYISTQTKIGYLNKTIDLKILNREKAFMERGYYQFLNLGIPLVLLGLFGIVFNLIRKRKYQ